MKQERISGVLTREEIIKREARRKEWFKDYFEKTGQRGFCTMCGRRLIDFKFYLKDWETRTLHKKCWVESRIHKDVDTRKYDHFTGCLMEELDLELDDSEFEDLNNFKI